MIRRKKITVVTDAMKTTTTIESKKKLEKMLKVPPDNQRLMYNEVILEDYDTLESVGITSVTSPFYRYRSSSFCVVFVFGLMVE